MISRTKIQFLFLLLLTGMLTSACISVNTPVPTITPVDTPTEAFTPTVVWFPATNTATPTVFAEPTTTPNLLPGLGSLLFEDRFEQTGHWQLAQTDAARINIDRQRLTLAILTPQTFVFTVRSQPILGDFYAEINARTNLCRGEDQYGMILRASGISYYRLVLTCDGKIRMERVTDGVRLVIYPDTRSGDVPPGAPGQVRIGAWLAGSEIRVFLNGRYQFSITDRSFSTGTIGVFARSASNSAVTVIFSELVVYDVSYASPTPSPTASKTPTPTRTPRP